MSGLRRQPVTEWQAILQIARRFNYHQNLCFPNVYFGGCEMDLAVVTRAGYLWEIEVKLSLSDWKADEYKRKWHIPDRPVSRFFYAVPQHLMTIPPSFVPMSAGILCVDGYQKGRQAQRTSARKLTELEIRRLLTSTYHKFWNLRVNHQTRRSPTDDRAD